MIERFRNDTLIANIMQKCALTEAQLDALLLSHVEGSLSSQARLRKSGVSKGSFWRTLKQGQSNVESSIYTLFLLAYLGFISEGRFAKLARTAELVIKIRETRPDKETTYKLLTAMEEFVMEFSGRRRLIL